MFARDVIGRRRLGSAAMFFAATAPFGIAAHLASEFAGLGWHDDADVVFSARHAYLAVIAAAGFLGLLCAIVSIPRAQRRARIAACIEGLPYGGRGLRFAAQSFFTQFAFFAVTQLGEGCPLCAGDVFVGVVAAAMAAVAGAIAITLGGRTFIALVAAIVASYRAFCKALAVDVRAAKRRVPIVLPSRAASFSFRYRPPPRRAE